MKKIMIIYFIPIVFLLTGCLNDPVQEDLLNYVNEEMTVAFELETTAITAYDQVSGLNYSDDLTMYETLISTVIPTYNEFVKELNNVQIETSELKEVHELYIEAADLQYNAFVIIVRALETQDMLLVEEANAMLEEARALIREYLNKWNALAEEHNVEWEKENEVNSL